MSKNKINEGLIDKAISSIFTSIGKGARKQALKQIAKKDPKIAKSIKDLEKEAITRTLKFFNNNRRKTARSLGLSERTLYRKIDEYGLEPKIKINS